MYIHCIQQHWLDLSESSVVFFNSPVCLQGAQQGCIGLGTKSTKDVRAATAVIALQLDYQDHRSPADSHSSFLPMRIFTSNRSCTHITIHLTAHILLLRLTPHPSIIACRLIYLCARTLTSPHTFYTLASSRMSYAPLHRVGKSVFK